MTCGFAACGKAEPFRRAGRQSRREHDCFSLIWTAESGHWFIEKRNSQRFPVPRQAGSRCGGMALNDPMIQWADVPIQLEVI